MNRTKALNKLESLFHNSGFNYLNVRGVINEIFDELERSPSLAKEKGKAEPPIKVGKSLPSSNAISIPTTAKARLEFYKDKMKVLESEGYNVKVHVTHVDLIHSEHHAMKYFPKSDRLQRCKDNKWIDGGFEYISNNLIYFKQ